jgi:RNA polymerase sigma-70 factor (ECF subfamily)
MILEAIVKVTDFFKPEAMNTESLEARFVRGDMAAMEEIMLTHQKGIFQLGLRLFCSRDKAADFYQDVFIRIFEKRHTYHPGRPLKPWLYQVAMNLGRDWLRKKQEVSLEEHMFEPVEMPKAEAVLLDKEVKEKIWQVVSQLHSTQREIIALRFSSDLSLQEIATILGVSLSAAKVRLCRSVKAFEDAFKAQGGEQYVL